MEADSMSEQLTLDEEYVDLHQSNDTAENVAGAGNQMQNLGTKSFSSTLTRAKMGCVWFAHVMRQLQAIEQLPDGWDSRRAGHPDGPTVRSAREVLAAMALADAALTKPHVDPTPCGGVQFDWESGPRYFEIEFIDPFNARYYFVDDEAHSEVEGELHFGDSLQVVIDHARSVRSNP
jgi:hypothetical protein